MHASHVEPGKRTHFHMLSTPRATSDLTPSAHQSRPTLDVMSTHAPSKFSSNRPDQTSVVEWRPDAGSLKSAPWVRRNSKSGCLLETYGCGERRVVGANEAQRGSRQRGRGEPSPRTLMLAQTLMPSSW